MTPPPSPPGFASRLARLARWPWQDVGLAAGLWAVPALALSAGAPGWVTAALGAVALLGLHLVVRRHGGWRLAGPHLFYDPIRLARRGRITVLRVLFLLTLLAGLKFAHHSVLEDYAGLLEINAMARLTQRFTFAFFVLQNLAIVFLTPVYVGSALAEERERKTLLLLYASPLHAWEIVLGKFGGRVAHLAGFVLAAVPILCLLQLWGGIDMTLMLGNLANTLLLLWAVGSLCILVSILVPKVLWAVLISYLLLALPGFGCAAALGEGWGSPLVLADGRTGGEGLLIQHLPTLAVLYGVASLTFLLGAVLVVWAERSPARGALPRLPARPAVARPAAVPAVAFAPGSPADVFAEARDLDHAADRGLDLPDPLPPVGDRALWWKERYTGGRTLFFTPAGLTLVTLCSIAGVSFLTAWTDPRARALVLDVYYYGLLLCYAFGVVFRATACVAREREQQTLDLLLQLPTLIDRRGLLWVKWLATLWRGWPWLALAGVVVLVGAALRVYAPAHAAWMLIAPWPVLGFLSAVGLYLSVALRGVLRANLTAAGLLLPFLLVFARGAINPITLPATLATSLPDARLMTMPPAAARALLLTGQVAGPTTADYVLAGLATAGLVAIYLFGTLVFGALAFDKFERKDA